MMSKLKNFFAWGYWLFWFLIRLILIVIGFPVVFLGLLLDDEKTWYGFRFWGKVEEVPEWWYKERGGKSRKAAWRWMAWRNKVPGMAAWFTQPCDARIPNPDQVVRVSARADNFALRTRCGPYIEFWYLKRIRLDSLTYKIYRRVKKIFGGVIRERLFFEYRIGWKFGKTTENFIPTIQLRLGG